MNFENLNLNPNANSNSNANLNPNTDETNFKSKYIEYKNAYIQLKKQIGGKHIIRRKGTQPVAGYIYTREPVTGIYYFGLVRKLYKDGRHITTYDKNGRQTFTGNAGAAGTNEKYWGKWTSIGGNRNPQLTNLEAIIEELNHEAAFDPYFDSKKVNLTPVGIPGIPGNPLSKITCEYVQEVSGTIIFVFVMEPGLFFATFPKQGITSPSILTASEGEIDAKQSYTMKQIIDLQANEYTNKTNNYFISYFLKNFRIVRDILYKASPEFKTKWDNPLGVIRYYDPDVKTRIPPGTELRHGQYIRPGNTRSYRL